MAHLANLVLSSADNHVVVGPPAGTGLQEAEEFCQRTGKNRNGCTLGDHNETPGGLDAQALRRGYGICDERNYRFPGLGVLNGYQVAVTISHHVPQTVWSVD
jgi:hypothetical protein